MPRLFLFLPKTAFIETPHKPKFSACLSTGEDLTAIRLDKILSIDFESLPLELAIKTQTGKDGGKAKTIAVLRIRIALTARNIG